MQIPPIERAENLVSTAEINAMAMFTPLLDKFPILQTAKLEHWDSILTVAGVFIAASRLNDLHLERAREDSLMDVVEERLNRWQPDGTRGFNDCKDFYESQYDWLATAGHESRFLAADALGQWIAWNVLGRSPQTDEESMLVRATGVMVTHAFFDWWD